MSAGDALLLLLAAAVATAVVFDWAVYVIVQRAARVIPRIPTLTIAAHRTFGIALGISVAALVLVHAVYFLITGNRIWPPEFGTLLIAAAVLIPTVGNIPTLLQVRRWQHEAREREGMGQTSPKRRMGDWR